MRNCRNCGDLPIEAFRPGSLHGRKCRECEKEYDRERNGRSKRKEQRAQADRMKKYGLSQADYEGMVEAQENCCAICSKEMSTPQVDHCHTHGHVRGLLCNRCNLGLGYFDDNPHVLLTAADYLS